MSSLRPPRPTPARALIMVPVALALALCAPAAGAATPATVTTGHAREVSYGSAVLSGDVNPEGSEASYYFQYGLTRDYGSQTTIAGAGSGKSAVPVQAAISGLQPLTLYHYRLVAVNAAGVAYGHEETLLTTKVPLSLQILAAPNPVPFGGTAVVQGTLSGTENAGRAVVLQEDSFPFAAGFQDVGNPELTSASGGFSFPLLGLTQVTQLRVVTTTNPPVASPVAEENVSVIVTSHVARTARAHFARVYGTVTPAETGMQVGILRIVRGRGVLVGGTLLRARNASSSSFSKVVRVHRGVYQVLVRVTGGAQISNYGNPLSIG